MGPWLTALMGAANSNDSNAPGGYPVNTQNSSGGWDQTGWGGGNQGGGGFNWGGLLNSGQSQGGNSYLNDIHKHGVGGIISGIMNLMSDYKNPSDEASKYINQIGGATGQYLNPYINAGKDAMGQLQGQYGDLINNPGGKLNQIGQSFQQSPGYQFQMGQGLNAANSAASAGGMLGSPAHQQNSQNVAQGLANQDYYNWMNHAQGMYGQGLQGLQGINQMGYGASNEMSQNIANMLQQQAQLGAAGVQNEAQNKAGGWGSIWGAFG